MTSQLNVDTISDKAGTGPVGLTKQSAAKVFCCYNGSGTPAIDVSLNVSTLTDVATGRQTVTYTNNMGSAHYSISGTVVGNGASYGVITSDTVVSTSSAMHPHTLHVDNIAQDMDRVSVTNHGDLA